MLRFSPFSLSQCQWLESNPRSQDEESVVLLVSYQGTAASLVKLDFEQGFFLNCSNSDDLVHFCMTCGGLVYHGMTHNGLVHFGMAFLWFGTFWYDV